MFDLSIITINYNNASGLKQTVNSVVNQSNKNFEYIIIDGNSTDRSKPIIDSLEFENLKWISEEDSGIYNAMNKGIKRATGDYLLFLNSGDHFCKSDSLTKIDSSMFQFDIISFNVECVRKNNSFTQIRTSVW